MPFIKQSRARYLPFFMPIVVLCATPPPRQLLESLYLIHDRTISFVHGSFSWVPDLLRAGVVEAEMVVCFGMESDGIY